MSIFKTGLEDGRPQKHLGKSKTMMNNAFYIPLLMIACVAVGYTLGSANSNIMTSTGNMNHAGQVGQKQKTTNQYPGGIASASSGVSRWSNHSIISNNSQHSTENTSHHYFMSNASFSNNVVEEIIPPSLLPVYHPIHLQWTVTRSMLRQSRPVVGNTQRLHLYLKKLHSKQCTKVVFMGGSVTAGHNAGGPKNAYPRLFMDWLNEKYPCVDYNGTTEGTHEYVKSQATESLTAFSYWTSVIAMEQFDLVFIEFNIGDSFVKSLPHALEDKGPNGATPEYQGSWYFEVLLRRLLLLRKPDPVAIITFSADYIGRIWATFDKWADPEESRKELFRKNQEPLKIWVSSMYEIPVFSAVIWMLPLAGKKGMEWQFNRTINPYSTSAWHTDACCHPSRPGHLILSLVLAYCLVEEEKAMLSFNKFDTADGEYDYTMDDPPILRQPLYLSPEEDEMYITSSATYGGVDFTESSKGEDSWKNVIVANEGWTWYADNKDKDKFGYIGENILGGPHIAMSLMGEKYGRVEVTYVISYENFGVSLAWLDESVENAHKTGLCNETKILKNSPLQPLNAIWVEQVSVPKTELLNERLLEGQRKNLHICLTPRDDGGSRKGTENKFKLLGVRMY